MRRPLRVAGVAYKPLAVYGTLMSGQPFEDLWLGLGTAEPCTIPGLRLVVSPSHNQFPYGMKFQNDTTVGELIWIEPPHYLDLLARLDRLEGVPHHYQRISHIVRTEEHLNWEAWLYVIEPRQMRRGIKIPNNDWRQFAANN